ncbi:MAG: preprotein translocase subunit YajC [Nocardioidaceae bacterium]|nr:preprotein translocase subunit YajC [Nocardioidaceae bacterium]
MNGDQWASLIPLLVIVAAFWFLVLRPARARQRQTLALQRQLGLGSTVMLTSGVLGEVTFVGDEVVELRIAPEVVITVHRSAVGRILADEDVVRMRNRTSPGDTTVPPVD